MNTKLQSLAICIITVGLIAAFERTNFAQAPAHSDVAYDDDHASQCVDVYLAKSDKPTPAMIYIHGGGWRAGSKKSVPGWLKSFVAEGKLSVVAVEYRFTDVATHPAQVNDCLRAIQFVRQNAEKWNIDPKRLGVTGGSAGGHLSAYVALFDDAANAKSDDPVKRQSSRVACAVSFSGPTDWSLLGSIEHRHPAYRQLIGYKPGTPATELKASLVKDVSPVSFVSKDDPPIMQVHGNKDDIVPLKHASNLHEKLESAGVKTELVVIPGGNHGVSGAGGDVAKRPSEFVKQYLLSAPDSAITDEGYSENPGTEGNGNFTIGPDYKIDPDLTDRGNPKGRSFEFSMRLADSKIFRGDDSTLDPKKEVRKERKIFVYVPAAYKDGTKAPILVTHDGPSRLNLVRNALDNLTISKDSNRKLPAFIVIAVQNGGNDSYGSQRGLEYDTMSDRLARFINDEVLPAALNNAEIKAAYPKIAFTDNPWGRAAMGCSSGGAAALTMGWFRPDLFRRLITYSGTFVDQQDDDAAEEAKYPLGAWEYHSSMNLIEKTKKKPLRIFTHVAENDLRANDPESTYHNWVMANQRTAAALKAKGYDYRFVFSRATRHCDRKVFEQTLADTLVWMWRGYHAE